MRATAADGSPEKWLREPRYKTVEWGDVTPDNAAETAKHPRPFVLVRVLGREE
jgi:hypothetical protein